MFTLSDVLQGNADTCSIFGNRSPDGGLVFRAAQHDSRLIQPGDMFIAITGEKVDGHRFIAAAAQAGARAVLCSKPSSEISSAFPDFLQIVVPDVVEALQATAHQRVQHQQGTLFIGITGSNGKTSTKDAVAEILGRQAPTLKTYNSYNAAIGYPVTLLGLEPEHRYAVLEMGAQWVGELTALSQIAAPNWTLITNVGASHLGYFGSQEQVVQAKSELVQVLTPDGLAILNYDDPNVRRMSEKTQARVLYYGIGEGAQVRASDIGGDALFGRRFLLSYQDQQTEVQLRIPGDHGVTIALAAAAVGCAAGIALDEIGQVLAGLKAVKRRGEIKPGPNGSMLIDDSYNANRQSIIAIARAMHDTRLAEGGKRWIVLGDILELGQYSESEHRAVGTALTKLTDSIVAIGDQARFYVEAAIEAGMPAQHTYYFKADIEKQAELEAAKQAAAELIQSQVSSADILLVKGSLGIGLDTFIAKLRVP